jgi:hypothetical protein
MAPPSTATPGGDGTVAKDNLDKAKKLIDDLEKKGCQVSEARGWYDQANDMYRSGLYRTSIIYSGYALDAANETVQRIKEMVLKVTKVKARAVDQLGKDNKNMPRIEEMIAEMKTAINEGRLDDCQELIGQVDEILRGGSSPYTSTKPVRVEAVRAVQPSRGYSSCPSCGNIVETSWKECKYCGQNLKDEEQEADGGPAWTSGDGGPRMVSDDRPDEEPPDEEKEQDVRSMERTQEDMEKVGTDLDRTEGEMVKETERTVDEETSADMREQETIEKEMEGTEADLEKGGPVEERPQGPEIQVPEVNMEEERRKALLERIKGWRDEGYDVARLEKTSDGDLTALRQELDRYAENVEKIKALTVRFKKLKSPKAQKIESFMRKPDEVPRLEKAIDKLESLESAEPKPVPTGETKPAPRPPDAELKPPEEPPKPEGPKMEPPKPEEPKNVAKPESPKRFSIPPPPKITFDDVPMPSMFSKKGSKKCPSCGEEVEPEFLKCPFCKTVLK